MALAHECPLLLRWNEFGYISQALTKKRKTVVQNASWKTYLYNSLILLSVAESFSPVFIQQAVVQVLYAKDWLNRYWTCKFKYKMVPGLIFW